MTSAVSICSNALLMNGAQTISSFTDNTDRARQCSNLYPTVRDYVLSSHPWNCCSKRIQLNPDTDTPAFDWSFQFTLPDDFLRLISVGEAGYEDDFRIESGKVLMDNAVLNLRYVWKNYNEASYSGLLVMAITLSMRAVLAYPVSQNASLEQLITQTIQPILKQSRAIDSTEQPPETLGDFRLQTSRFTPRSGGSQ